MVRVLIHDTTLRDGEQMPGVVFSFEEKLTLTEKFIDFGVDLIDIMPTVSKTEFRLTKNLADFYPDKISASCRLKKEDIDLTLQSGVKRITLFTPLSDIHLEKKLRISREENLIRSEEMIDYARSHGLEVDFAGEDSTRVDMDYLLSFIKSVENKVEIFFIADTLGCLTPKSTFDFISKIKQNCNCKIGFHVHNDFGLATANTLEGIRAGVDVFSGTFTGIGERAGNAPIEEVCTGLKFLHSIELNVKYEKLTDICRQVEEFSGVRLQRHKPIVGTNVFSHESGIHVDGVIKNPSTYEYFNPSFVGQKRQFFFGKHSGGGALRNILGNIPREHLIQFLNILKTLSEMGKVSFSKDDVVYLSNYFQRMNDQGMVELP
ncbi:MAG: homoaconitate hydratase [Candidatus Aenigmarchaeota archaeon]